MSEHRDILSNIQEPQRGATKATLALNVKDGALSISHIVQLYT